MKASENQIGGKHYKDYPIQPAEFCQRNKLPWCESNVVKLVTRHQDKGGVQDIDKAIHYLQLLKEWEYWQPEPHTPTEARPGRRGEKEVYAFAEAMIETLNLPKNAEKGGWGHLTYNSLLLRLEEEVQELREAIGKGDGVNAASEATDVGAFAMMLFEGLSSGEI